MTLPIYTFWELSQNASRIKADDDLRNVKITALPHSDNSEELIREIERKRGEIVEIEEIFDRSSFQKLKFMTTGNKDGN
jgi:hypothetical protein